MVGMQYVYSIALMLESTFLSFCVRVGGIYPRLGVSAAECDACESRPGSAVCSDAGPG